MANESEGMSGKNIAIISYITLIGWIIAFVMNQKSKDNFASFHIRQMLGLLITGVATNFLYYVPFVSIVSMVLSLGLVVLWVLGIISAANGEEKPVPVLGEFYQEWFKNV